MLTEIDPAGGPECRNRFAGARVERIDEIVNRGEHAFVLTAAPVHDRTIRPAPADARIEGPQRGTGIRPDREGLVRRRVAVEHAVDHDGLRLHRTGFPGVEGPRDLELLDVAPVYLCQRRVPNLFRSAAVARPSLTG